VGKFRLRRASGAWRRGERAVGRRSLPDILCCTKKKRGGLCQEGGQRKTALGAHERELSFGGGNKDPNLRGGAGRKEGMALEKRRRGGARKVREASFSKAEGHFVYTQEDFCDIQRCQRYWSERESANQRKEGGKESSRAVTFRGGKGGRFLRGRHCKTEQESQQKKQER